MAGNSKYLNKSEAAAAQEALRSLRSYVDRLQGLLPKFATLTAEHGWHPGDVAYVEWKLWVIADIERLGYFARLTGERPYGNLENIWHHRADYSELYRRVAGWVANPTTHPTGGASFFPRCPNYQAA